MDFTVVDNLASYREEARRWVAENIPELKEEALRQRKTGDTFNHDIHRRLAKAGWIGAGWPKEYGGSDKPVGLARAVMQELARNNVREVGWQTSIFVLRTILDLGTEEQKKEIVGGALRGDIVIALGYSEPDGGSDVAAARTRAVRDGDEWVINGQKMFTTSAHLNTHIFMILRTDPNAPKHEGLTTILVPRDQPGIEVRGIWTLSGERTNATFYTDARAPDRFRVGKVNGGWDVMRTALIHERAGGGDGSQPVSTACEDFAKWAQKTERDDGGRVWDNAAVREQVVRYAIENEVAKGLGMWASWSNDTGDRSGVPNAACKLFNQERANYRDWGMIDLLGPEGALTYEAPDAPMGASIQEDALVGTINTIAGGSSEIMRNIIAERGLGLPRSRPDKG
jgi:alkylation response protein AidB-like acyl-CoA dehydrogenase